LVSFRVGAGLPAAAGTISPKRSATTPNESQLNAPFIALTSTNMLAGGHRYGIGEAADRASLEIRTPKFLHFGSVNLAAPPLLPTE
jgi:hypothetical protein